MFHNTCASSFFGTSPKTHLSIAAAKPVSRVYCVTLADLITALKEAQKAGHLAQRLRTLFFPGLLVIDEIG